MNYYHTCPDCGAHLDPAERCDCQKEQKNLVSCYNDVDPGRYALTWKEAQEFCAHAHESMLDTINAAYNYGFVRGQRAEKARKKKSAPAAGTAETHNEPKPTNSTNILSQGAANVKGDEV